MIIEQNQADDIKKTSLAKTCDALSKCLPGRQNIIEKDNTIRRNFASFSKE